MYQPITFRERCLTQVFDLARGDLLDDFKRDPSFGLIKDSVLDLPNLTEVDKSIAAATVDELCGRYKIKRPEWVFDSSTYLDKPHFAMNAKGPLRIVLLRESPKWYRSRNLFVSSNCSERA